LNLSIIKPGKKSASPNIRRQFSIYPSLFLYAQASLIRLKKKASFFLLLPIPRQQSYHNLRFLIDVTLTYKFFIMCLHLYNTAVLNALRYKIHFVVVNPGMAAKNPVGDILFQQNGIHAAKV